MFSTSLGRFRAIALIEGISSIALFFVAMPLKYLADLPMAVRIAGSAHGALFVLYLLLGLGVAIEHEWGLKRVALYVLASIGPGTTLLLEPQLKADFEADRAAQAS